MLVPPSKAPSLPLSLHISNEALDYAKATVRSRGPGAASGVLQALKKLCVLMNTDALPTWYEAVQEVFSAMEVSRLAKVPLLF